MAVNIKKICAMLCLIIFATAAVPAGGAGDVPLREKYTYGSDKNLSDEYTRFLKYPYYASIVREYGEKRV